MVVDKLEKYKNYRWNGRMKRAFKFLLGNDLASLEKGRVDIDGDNIYAMVQSYDSKPLSEGAWEAHRKYADIQVVVSGAEQIGYAEIGSLTEKPYDEEKDFMKLTGEGGFCRMSAGMFMVLYPQDAHMPGLAIGTPVPVTKIVVKVRV